MNAALEQETLRALFGMWRLMDRKVGAGASKNILDFLGDDVAILELLLPPKIFLRIPESLRLQQSIPYSDRVTIQMARRGFPLCCKQLEQKASSYDSTMAMIGFIAGDFVPQFRSLFASFSLIASHGHGALLEKVANYLLYVSVQCGQIEIFQELIARHPPERQAPISFLEMIGFPRPPRRDLRVLETILEHFDKIPTFVAYRFAAVVLQEADMREANLDWGEILFDQGTDGIIFARTQRHYSHPLSNLRIPYKSIIGQFSGARNIRAVATKLQLAGVSFGASYREALTIAFASGNYEMVTTERDLIYQCDEREIRAAIMCGQIDLLMRLEENHAFKVTQMCSTANALHAAVLSDCGVTLNWVEETWRMNTAELHAGLLVAVEHNCAESFEWLLRSGAKITQSVFESIGLHDRASCLRLCLEICGNSITLAMRVALINRALESGKVDAACILLDCHPNRVIVNDLAYVPQPPYANLATSSTPLINRMHSAWNSFRDERKRIFEHPNFDLKGSLIPVSFSGLSKVATLLGKTVHELIAIRNST